MSKMTELARAKLARPLDPNNMSNDIATLRQLVGELNNPAVTGATGVVEKPDPDPVGTPAVAVVEKPEPVRAPDSGFSLSSRRLMFTGAEKVGKSWLAEKIGARVFELSDPIRAIVQSVFGRVTEAQAGDLYRQLWAWGSGIISKSAPLTAERMSFVMQTRLSKAPIFGIDSALFGHPQFWLQSLVARIDETCAATDLVAVTDVGTSDQYNYLRKAGFTPIHVMCNNTTRAARGGQLSNALATAVEREVTNKISQSPRGPKLWAVWCDDKYAVPSKRFLTVDEFVRGLQ